MFALEVKNLRKSYGKTEALKGVSFEVSPGEIFGLLGPNGAGKTTLIGILTTLEKPTEGETFVFGKSVQQSPAETKKMLGVVHQEVINSGFFTVNEILNFLSGYYGISKNQERIDFLLHKLSLWDHKDKNVRQLSGGMKRRLMIAKALVHTPKVLLLDEPTAGVDIRLREDLWNFVSELRKEGMTILLTTHYLEEAESLCDRIGIINLGKLECAGDTKEIISRFTQKSVELVLTAEINIKSEFLVSRDNNSYRFVIPQDVQLGKMLSDLNIPLSQVQDVKISEGSLEEAFLKVLGERTAP